MQVTALGKIAANPKLKTNTAYLQKLRSHYQTTPIVTRARTLGKADAPPSQSNIVQVGNQPDGFGSGFIWGREENEAFLVVFLNAGDSMGISIDGLEPWDNVEVISATGLASFSESSGSIAGSIIGLLGLGAKVVTTLGGYAAALPVIEAAEKYAKEQFKQDKVKTKRRDPWGQDPGTGLRARQEGGVLVCMPAARGAYYSGDSSHKERWIKDNNPRTTANIPDHILSYTAFFLNRDEKNIMQTEMAGQAFIIPWDYKFEDNVGYYKLFVKLSKGTPPTILKPKPYPRIKVNKP